MNKHAPPAAGLPHPQTAAALAGWLDYLRDIRRCSLNTLENYRRHVRDCLAALDKEAGFAHSPEQLGEADIALFRAWTAGMYRRGISARSAAAALSAVRRFFGYLEREGRISGEPAIYSLSAPRKPKLLPKPAEKREIFRLLNEWPAVFPGDAPHILARDIALVTLLYATGMRISEALSLNAGMIGEATRYFYITGKGAKERRVSLIAPARDRVLAYLALSPAAADAPLFRGARGKRLSRAVAAKRLQTARRTLGVSDSITPHALRHSFATDMLRAGGDLRTVQELLGHADISATQIYTKIADDACRTAVLTLHPRTMA